MARLSGLIGAIAAILLAVNPAAARIEPMLPGMLGSVPTEKGSVVRIIGDIERGDYQLFIEVVNAANPDIIVLDSPGGYIDEALLIAAAIHYRGLNTFIYGNRYCMSACALMFLSGATKYANPGALVGLHSAAYLDGSRSIVGTAVMAAYLAAIGVPYDLIGRMWKTEPVDMYWLSEADQDLLDIVVLGRPAPPKETGTGSLP